MKICVLVPNEDFLGQAGVRIRYERIIVPLGRLGHTLDIVPLTTMLRHEDLSHNLYLISKVYDARSAIVAEILKKKGIPFGIDLFDDYFTQELDSRLVRLRRWLLTVGNAVDFVLCSTPAMAELAGRVLPSKPVHIMNDPSPPLDTEALRGPLAAKRAALAATRVLRVTWFGMGDNPNFPVGLHDLISFGGELAKLRRKFDTRLEILTNERAVTSVTLGALSRLPVPYDIRVWSETAEAEILARSMCAFIPVNAQNFSIVKSLNRCVSALATGTQILSVGYPLYQAFSPLIYRDPLALLSDLESGKPLLREETLPDLAKLMVQFADADREASDLSVFFGRIGKNGPTLPPYRQPAAAILHGRATSSDVHKLTQRLGAISIGSPICTSRLHFDLHFKFSENHSGLDVHMTEKNWKLLSKKAQENLLPAGKIGEREAKKIEIRDFFEHGGAKGAEISRSGDMASVVAGYLPLMHGLRAEVGKLFPNLPCHISELSTLPLQS